MKHAITVLGVATLLAGVAPAIYAQPTTTILARNQESLSQQAADKLKSGDYKGALEAYNQVLQLDANDTDAYVSRGIARFNLGDRRGAIEDFTHALSLNPNNSEAYSQRGGVYLIMGNKRKAREDFRQAAKISRGEAPDSTSQQPQAPITPPQQ